MADYLKSAASFWQGIVRLVAPQRPAGAPPVDVPAAEWPIWEQQTPQYPQPQPYNLAQVGYRQNELVYSCIRRRAGAISEAPLRVYREDSDGYPSEERTHALRKLMRRPNPYLTESQFWQYVTTYKDIAGFSPWEIEFDRMGNPVGLWPMLPHWCSFIRGDREPLRVIRYQPYGLPPVDIPRQNILFFQDLDPLFPFIKGLSRSAVALRVTTGDNQLTDFVTLFMQRGAVMQGVLSVQQSLQDSEAERIKARWRQTHGGVRNWGDIAVLGNGAQFEPVQMNFKQMDFSAIDGRSEARICMCFDIPPILLNATITAGAMTYNNYREARKAWYEQSISTEWRYLASEISEQLLPMFEGGEVPEDIYTEFDERNIKALQEDRDAKFKRALDAFQRGVLTRDEAREEMEYDPIDDAEIFMSGIPATPSAPAPVAEAVTPPMPAEAVPAQSASEAAKALERRQFRAFASRRAKEGNPQKAFEFEFKHLSAHEQRALFASVVMLTEQAGLASELRKAREVAERGA